MPDHDTAPLEAGDLDEDTIIDLRSSSPVLLRETRDIPFVDLGAEYETHGAELRDAIEQVLARGDFILGEATALFEHEFASYCGVRHGVGTDSGFSALELALRAFDIGPGDEVITAANTFYSTARAIEACGATPVLVDADPVYRNMDPGLIEAAITPATRALMPVHLYGHPADMNAINAIAVEHELIVIEDAAQAHGSMYRDGPIGSLSDAAAFSFYPSKNLGAFGDAGIVLTNRQDIDERLRHLRNLGSTIKYQHEGPGFNRRLDTLQAAVLRVKLRYLDDANKARRQAAEWYGEALADADVDLPTTADWAEPVFHLYVVETPHRDQIAAALDQVGASTGIHYPVPIHLIPAFASLGYNEGDFPVAEELAASILSLPMHPYLSFEDVTRVAMAIRRAFERRP